jgi:hypothetical protein
VGQRRPIVGFSEIARNKGLLIAIVAILVTAAGAGLIVASTQGLLGGGANPSGGISSGTASRSTSGGLSLVTVSGTVRTTGKGTRATLISFGGGSGTFTSIVTNGTYSVTLANAGQYSVQVSWKGSYAWQSGTVAEGDYSPSQTASAAPARDFQVATPDSDSTVFGAVSTSGSGTKANALVFSSSQTPDFVAKVSNGSYSVVLPNGLTYKVTVSWSGAYSWQAGNSSQQLLLNDTLDGPEHADFANVPTPDSTVAVSGTVTTSGKGTYPLNIAFVSTETGRITANVSNEDYKTSVPNDVNYSVEVAWHGQYSWQLGSDTWLAGKEILVNQGPGAGPSFTRSFNLPTPDSNATVTGFVSTTGASTFPNLVTFAGRGGSYVFPITYLGSTESYNLTLPNIDTYNVTVAWKGLEPWQKGSQGFAEYVNVAAGGSADVANYTLNTPASLASVTGHVTTSPGSTPVLITFYLTDGTLILQDNVASDGSYSEYLFTGTVYDVVISWQSFFTTGRCSAGELYLNVPGATTYTADFSC